MTVAAMAVNGVLRAPVGGYPISEGVLLYHSLAEYFNLVLLADEEMGDWDDFALVNALHEHSVMVPWKSARPRLFQCNALRLSGYAVGLVIDPDPSTCALLVRNGFNTMLFTHAEYAHPSWRPDTALRPRPWDDIRKQVAENAAARLADTRSD